MKYSFQNQQSETVKFFF